MKATFVILSLALLAASPALGIEPEARIIPQAGAPLTITSYAAVYQGGGGYSGITHMVEYTNSSDKPIVAVQIVWVSFDVWNEFIDRNCGVSLEEVALGISKKGVFVELPGDFTFFTGFAYVNKVRFRNGTIWTADLGKIAEELLKVEADFDVMKLKGKPEGGMTHKMTVPRP